MIMNSVPAAQRGVASGMRMTFMNSGQALSIGAFFSLMVIGLASALPKSLTGGLVGQGVPHVIAAHLGSLPPVGILFAAFLGVNPIGTLLGPTGLLHTLPTGAVHTLTGSNFFTSLISAPFHSGLELVFAIAALMMVVTAVASWFAGRPPERERSHPDSGERTGEDPHDYAVVESELSLEERS
jgi:hypothetical protein